MRRPIHGPTPQVRRARRDAKEHGRETRPKHEAEAQEPLSELAGWLFPPYQSYKAVVTLQCDSLAAARHLAARELAPESRHDHFAVWFQRANKLFIKQPAGASIPQVRIRAASYASRSPTLRRTAL